VELGKRVYPLWTERRLARVFGRARREWCVPMSDMVRDGLSCAAIVRWWRGTSKRWS
jgi:hypothetical protein